MPKFRKFPRGNNTQKPKFTPVEEANTFAERKRISQQFFQSQPPLLYPPGKMDSYTITEFLTYYKALCTMRKWTQAEAIANLEHHLYGTPLMNYLHVKDAFKNHNIGLDVFLDHISSTANLPMFFLQSLLETCLCYFCSLKRDVKYRIDKYRNRKTQPPVPVTLHQPYPTTYPNYCPFPENNNHEQQYSHPTPAPNNSQQYMPYVSYIPLPPPGFSTLTPAETLVQYDMSNPAEIEKAVKDNLGLEPDPYE